VAVSFAGEDRSLVESVLSRVKGQRDLKIFYDDDFKVESWGKDQVEYFTDVYTKQARFAIMFISDNYAKKMWTRLERRSILSRAINDHSEYVLPVRLDDTQLEGLLHTVGFLDQRREGVDGIASAIIQKTTGQQVELSDDWTTGVPLDEPSTQALLVARPPGWQYMYYAGLIMQGVKQNETRFLDMEMGYSAYRRTHLDLADAHDFLRGMPSRYLSMSSAVNAVLDPTAQTRAFGDPDVAGEPDPDRIRHLAQRLVDVYTGFLDVIEDIRGTTVPDEIKEARDLAARAGERPVSDMKAFFEKFADEASTFPQRLTAGEDIHLELVFTLDLEDNIMSLWADAMNRAAARV